MHSIQGNLFIEIPLFPLELFLRLESFGPFSTQSQFFLLFLTFPRRFEAFAFLSTCINFCRHLASTGFLYSVFLLCLFLLVWTWFSCDWMCSNFSCFDSGQTLLSQFCLFWLYSPYILWGRHCLLHKTNVSSILITAFPMPGKMES